MNRFEADMQVLKRPAIILLVVAVIATALLWGSDHYKSVRVIALQEVRSDLKLAREEYRLAVEADGILRTSQQRYRQLLLSGFVGDEPRLLWIESLRNTGADHHLYNLQYSLRQRQSVQLSGPKSTQHYQLYVSPMQMQLDLAHEVDLLRYFSDLNRQRPAVYQLRGCQLKPMFSESGIQLHKANVSADCDLLWYTVNEPGSVETVEDVL